MSNSPDGIYEKGIIDPGLPVSNSTKSFWLAEPAAISKLRSPWPKHADVVIIGSGMTAASLAYTLYSKRPNLQIVIVEARDLCSGATGRNGGHIKAMSPGAWFDRKKQFGVQEAVRIMEYEHSHLEEMASCIKENKIDCDLNVLEGLDVYYDDKVFRHACNAVEDMRKYAPSLADRYSIYTTSEDLKARNCPEECVGVIGMAAGSMWPYKMVTALLDKMVKEKGLSIQANTVVTSVDEEDGATFATVKTDRGEIRGKPRCACHKWLGWPFDPGIASIRLSCTRQCPAEESAAGQVAIEELLVAPIRRKGLRLHDAETRWRLHCRQGEYGAQSNGGRRHDGFSATGPSSRCDSAIVQLRD